MDLTTNTTRQRPATHRRNTGKTRIRENKHKNTDRQHSNRCKPQHRKICKQYEHIQQLHNKTTKQGRIHKSHNTQ